VTDPGHPFTVAFQDLVESLQDSLSAGVLRSGEQALVFHDGVLAVDLPPEALSVVQVRGLQGGRPTVFTDLDYTVEGALLTWRRTAAPQAPGHAPLHPDDGSRFVVEHTYRQPASGLTDFGPGTVIGILVRAVARELALASAATDEAYRRGFLDVATGTALDNVVALLGVRRHPAQPATGYVTFSRRAGGDPSLVPVGTVVQDPGARAFATTAPGTLGGVATEVLDPQGAVVRTSNRIASLVRVTSRADPDTDLPTVDTAPRHPFGDDERTVTLASPAAGPVQVAYAAKSVRVPVAAVQPGPLGNVDAGTVTVMPTPPVGVDGVTNEDPITGGAGAEQDEELRERARHALERAGNATLGALRFGVLGIDGVDAVDVVDHTADDQVQLGEVHVRYATAAGDAARADAIRQEVVDTVDRTRPAGVLARVQSITAVLVSGTVHVVLAPDAVPGTPAEVRDALVAGMRALRIGEPLLLRRLTAAALRVPGVTDVVESRLRYRKDDPDHPGGVLEGDVTEPLLVASAERVQPDAGDLTISRISGLAAAAAGTDGDARLVDVGLLGPSGEPVVLGSVELSLRAGLRAPRLRTPADPPERIGEVTATVRFTGSASATLRLTPADLAGFDPAVHDPHVSVVLRAATYDALPAVTVVLDLG
jgi:phage-related baseplate assembly protein